MPTSILAQTISAVAKGRYVQQFILLGLLCGKAVAQCVPWYAMVEGFCSKHSETISAYFSPKVWNTATLRRFCIRSAGCLTNFCWNSVLHSAQVVPRWYSVKHVDCVPKFGEKVQHEHWFDSCWEGIFHDELLRLSWKCPSNSPPLSVWTERLCNPMCMSFHLAAVSSENVFRKTRTEG